MRLLLLLIIKIFFYFTLKRPTKTTTKETQLTMEMYAIHCQFTVEDNVSYAVEYVVEKLLCIDMSLQLQRRLAFPFYSKIRPENRFQLDQS